MHMCGLYLIYLFYTESMVWHFRDIYAHVLQLLCNKSPPGWCLSVFTNLQEHCQLQRCMHGLK